MAANWKTIKVVYELSVHDDADAEQVAQDTFERLCDLYDAPFYACDGWEMLDTELRRAGKGGN